MEDERNFSNLTVMKTILWNRLCEHLDLVVPIFAQPFYSIDIFHYDDVTTTWTNEKKKGGLLA